MHVKSRGPLNHCHTSIWWIFGNPSPLFILIKTTLLKGHVELQLNFFMSRHWDESKDLRL